MASAVLGLLKFALKLQLMSLYLGKFMSDYKKKNVFFNKIVFTAV